MAATRPHRIRPAPADGAPAIPESEAPAGGSSLTRTAHLTFTAHFFALLAALGAPRLDLPLSTGACVAAQLVLVVGGCGLAAGWRRW
ncbi:hypothetical protein Sliba_45910 [Streptomyces nigrescens]|uniref:Uncharacterized protein n=1 Tax=Streptomyces nigrescens TaxID=1920 RepID=A0A640TL23_STRNI|nr:hypothetical protein Sliba_45910 [Streptomyces libani subsp. libani]GGV99985.1 hypothetical protein GCM10010500_52020 [Streptomyces libani subsp. libani]